MAITVPPLALPSSPVDTSAASTYTDVNALESLKQDPTSPQAISAVAGQVEALFLQMMLKSMRDATAADDPDSNEMGMYQDMFDKQVALAVSQHDDLGIGRLLKRQLSPSKGASLKPLSGLSSVMPAAGETAGVLASATMGGAGSGAAAGATGMAAGMLSEAMGGASGGAAGMVAGAGGRAAGAAPALAQSPAEFVQRVLPSIRRAAGELGVNPMGLLAQAALETGWGQRLPRTADGASSLNIFGVKAGDGWSGARATADTVEFSNGVASLRRTAFRAYASVEDSVRDFANLLKDSPRYRDALAAGGDSQAYLQSIAKAGYATDPEYSIKLNRILNSDTLQAALAPRTAAL